MAGAGAGRGRAIVTGASSGIGAALAPKLAAAGYDLLLVARRGELLEALAARLRAEHRVSVEALVLDVAADDALERLQAVEPAPAVLINNAGVGLFGSILSHPAAAQAGMVRLNCEALTRLTAGYLPAMVARGEGVVLNVGSIAGFQPVPFYAAYAASKAFVQSLSEALDEELRGTGVRVAAVCPGPVPTEFQGKAGSPPADGHSSWTVRSPEAVAQICLETIQRPRRVVVPAGLHRLLRFVQRFLPRSTVLAFAARGMRKREGGGLPRLPASPAADEPDPPADRAR